MAVMNFKIAVFGAYSGRNKGDLGILTSIAYNLLYIEKDILLSIPSKNPEMINSSLPKFEGNIIKIVKSITGYWGIKTFNIIKNSDLIIIGGGGLLFDRKLYNIFFNHVTNLFFIILVNKIFFKKPVYIFSVGAGKINSKIAIYMIQVILRNSNYVTVRDNNTYNVLSKYYTGTIKIFFDPVFLLRKSEKPDTYIHNYLKDIEGKKKVLVVINQVFWEQLKIKHKTADLVDIINRLQDQYLVVLSSNITKLKQVEILHSLCRKENLKIFYPYETIPEDIIFFYSKFDYIVCAPMHAAIFAYNAGTKMVTIEYDHKVLAFNEIIGNTNTVSIDDILQIPWLLEHYCEIDWVKEIEIQKNAQKNFINLKEVINEIKDRK